MQRRLSVIFETKNNTRYSVQSPQPISMVYILHSNNNNNNIVARRSSIIYSIFTVVLELESYVKLGLKGRVLTFKKEEAELRNY